jgi:hypothetical protein
MAQLPSLVYEQRPPMSCAAYKALAESLLSKKDMTLFNILSLDPAPEDTGLNGLSYAQNLPSCGCKFIDSWRSWERNLRLNLAKLRTVKLGLENEPVIEPSFFPVETQTAAANALEGDLSPLEGEFVIDKARWSAIEALAGNEYFSLNNALAYLLKLMLLERRMAFNAEKGFAEYKSLYASINESVQKSVGEPK